MDKLTKVAAILACTFIAYFMIATVRYAFTHPEQTDMQRLLNTKKALMWGL
jgi:hypothetical protein